MGCGRLVGENCKNASCLMEICDNFFYGDLQEELEDINSADEIICQTNCSTCTNDVCFYDKAEVDTEANEENKEDGYCACGVDPAECPHDCDTCIR